MRSGTSYGSLLSVPSGSPPMTGVKGGPELACHVPTARQSLSSQACESAAGEGKSTVRCTETVCAILKSEGPCASRRSYQGKLEIEFENWSPATVAEPLSRLFSH